MKLTFYLAFALLVGLSVLSCVLSMQCNETQYAWPWKGPRHCCNKCPPGQYMAQRSPDSCQHRCESCRPDQYSANYNVNQACDFCQSCDDENMEIKSACNTTHNTVCKCKAGYRCDDQKCTKCVQIPATVKPPSPTPDNKRVMVIIIFLCVVAAFLIITPFLHWIILKHGKFLTEKRTPLPTCSEDESISTPIQEVSVKCDRCMN